MEINNKISKCRRLDEWDFIKGILIFCVVWGHMRTYMCGSCVRDINIYPPFIPIFQMPLFIMVSGLFAKSSPDFSTLVINAKKYAKSLLIPYISWGVITMVIHVISELLIIDNPNIRMSDIYSNKFGLLWYMGTILLCHATYNLFTYALKGRISKKRCLSLLFSCLVISMIISEDFYSFFFLFPFYLIGVMLRGIDLNGIFSKHSTKNIIFVLTFISVITSYYYPQKYTFYEMSNDVLIGNGLDIVKHFLIVIVRYIFYISVSISALFWIFRLYKTIVGKKITDYVITIGNETLFIYLAHISLLYYTMRPIVIKLTDGNGFFFNFPILRYYVLGLTVAFTVIYLLHRIYKLVSKSPLLSEYLLGKKY